MAVALDLADLLSSAGFAMAASNTRLAVAGAPALLQQFQLTLAFTAGFEVPVGACTLFLTGASRPNAQMQALFRQSQSNVTTNATYIAAPSLPPGTEVRGP
jgi:hypothetical protein